MSAEARLAYHQHYSGPIMDRLKHWLDQQFAERTVEPNSSLGSVSVPAHPLADADTVSGSAGGTSGEQHRGVGVGSFSAIRQRKNSLFYATDYSAYIASMLTSLIATCLHSGGIAFDQFGGIARASPRVFQAPEAWLPWNYHANLAPP